MTREEQMGRMVSEGWTVTLLCVEHEFFCIAQSPRSRTRVGVGKSFLAAQDKMLGKVEEDDD